MFEIVDDNTIAVQGRGMRISVTFYPEREDFGRFMVVVDNASARAWNGMASWRYFDNLDAVESKYKMLRGVKAFFEEMDASVAVSNGKANLV